MASAPITILVDGLPVTFCSDGMADGCFELRSRGYGVQYSAITVWPSYRHRHLTSGRDTRHLTFSSHLFQPEFAIYLQEVRAAIQDALASLAKPDAAMPKCAFCKINEVLKFNHKYCSEPCRKKAMAWTRLQKKLKARTA